MWDERDYYNVLVPPGKYLEWNVSFTSSDYVYTYVYKCQVQTQPCSGANPAYYVSQPNTYTGSPATMSHTSGLWVTNGGWLTLGVYTYGAEDLTYTMDFNFLDLSNLVGGVQDDAGSGSDAGTSLSDAVHVNDYNNMTNDTLFFEGWNHGDVDTTDRFTFDVPANYGYDCLLYTSPSPRDRQKSRMPSSA